MTKLRTRRPPHLLLAAIGIAMALTAAGCGSTNSAKSSTGSTGSTGATSKTPIVVGVQFALTGADAAFSTYYNQAAKIVFSGVHTLAGHPVRFVYADDASDPATAVSVTRKFVEQNHVNVLYGPSFTDTTLAVAKIASSTKVPLYSPGSISPQLTSPLQKDVFAAQFSSVDVAHGIAALVNSMHANKVGLLEESDSYGQAALSSAKSALAKYGLTVNTVQTISDSATDATSQLQAFASAGDNVVLLGVTAPPMAAALSAEIHLGSYIPLITFAGSTSALDKTAESNKKIRYYALTPLACNLGASCSSSFMATWKKHYPSTPPIVWAAQAYAAAKAFVADLGKITSTSGSGIVSGFQKAPKYTSPLLACGIVFSASSHKGTDCTDFYGITGGKVSFFGPTLNKNSLG